MPHYIIRKMRLAHCQRGPTRCEKCREMDGERIYLLDICPPDEGRIQRRVVQVNIGGKQVWREFDVIRVFESQAEAKGYADKNGMVNIQC